MGVVDLPRPKKGRYEDRTLHDLCGNVGPLAGKFGPAKFVHRDVDKKSA
jgi:hypothetical protein